MNERIKKLMHQAGTDTSGKWMGVDNAEKFAKLIIQECAQFCEDKNSKLLGTMMKEHFEID